MPKPAATRAPLRAGAEREASCARRRCPAGEAMVQKVIEIVGVSSKSFAAAAEDAVTVAARTVRDMKWARVSELEMELDGKRIKNYRATMRIYFEVER